MKQATLFK